MSNGLTSSLKEVHTPEMAIIVYSGSNNSVYLERRDITDGKMGAGKPLSKECITSLIKAIAEDSDEIEIGYHGIIPRNLLFADTTTGRTRLVWYNPPMTRRMFFTENMGIPEGEIMVPGIVYVADNNSLSVYVFKGKEPKDKLFQAPFFNVNDHGVCLGSAKVAKPKNLTYHEAIKYWEKMFWNSEFSHLYGANPINGNLAVITKSCIEKGTPFPTKVLIKSKTTLSDLLK